VDVVNRQPLVLPTHAPSGECRNLLHSPIETADGNGPILPNGMTPRPTSRDLERNDLGKHDTSFLRPFHSQTWLVA
jgi:hypothetical protein